MAQGEAVQHHHVARETCARLRLPCRRTGYRYGVVEGTENERVGVGAATHTADSPHRPRLRERLRVSACHSVSELDGALERCTRDVPGQPDVSCEVSDPLVDESEPGTCGVLSLAGCRLNGPRGVVEDSLQKPLAERTTGATTRVDAQLEDAPARLQETPRPEHIPVRRGDETFETPNGLASVATLCRKRSPDELAYREQLAMPSGGTHAGLPPSRISGNRARIESCPGSGDLDTQTPQHLVERARVAQSVVDGKGAYKRVDVPLPNRMVPTLREDRIIDDAVIRGERLSELEEPLECSPSARGCFDLEPTKRLVPV